MHRFYVPPDQSQNAQLWLAGREAHHALHVLRVRPGEQVTVLDGAGGQCLCQVQTCERHRVLLLVQERKTVPPLPFQITLLQAIPKGKIIEGIIQKATELGATRIVPLLAERVTTRLEGNDARKKSELWQAVAVDAIKQCGAAWLPKVEAPITPSAFLARHEPFDLRLVASLPTGVCYAREHFRTFHRQHGTSPGSVCIWVGPEGDFTPGEVAAIEAGGALPMTLGKLVLRCETAALYCLSIVAYELLSAGDGLGPGNE